jgi:hypothetical protein
VTFPRYGCNSTTGLGPSSSHFRASERDVGRPSKGGDRVVVEALLWRERADVPWYDSTPAFGP